MHALHRSRQIRTYPYMYFREGRKSGTTTRRRGVENSSGRVLRERKRPRPSQNSLFVVRLSSFARARDQKCMWQAPAPTGDLLTDNPWRGVLPIRGRRGGPPRARYGCNRSADRRYQSERGGAQKITQLVEGRWFTSRCPPSVERQPPSDRREPQVVEIHPRRGNSYSPRRVDQLSRG